MITEKQLHLQICTYLKLQYPKVIFNTDASGMKMSIGEAVRVKKLRSSNSIPDIVIYEQYYPNINLNLSYAGLFLEVKAKTPYKKDGKLKAGEHLQKQNNMLNSLNEKGYKAVFVWEFEQAKEIIDKYLK